MGQKGSKNIVLSRHQLEGTRPREEQQATVENITSATLQFANQLSARIFIDAALQCWQLKQLLY
jgi:hypothetical protein